MLYIFKLFSFLFFKQLFEIFWKKCELTRPDGSWMSLLLPRFSSLYVLSTFFLFNTHQSALRRICARRITPLYWWKSLLLPAAQTSSCVIHTSVAASMRPSVPEEDKCCNYQGKRRHGRESCHLPLCLSLHILISFLCKGLLSGI